MVNSPSVRPSCRGSDVGSVPQKSNFMVFVFFCLQLNLNNRPLSQMLKSSAPAAVVEQDPLEYYDQLTSQIEVQLLLQFNFIVITITFS